MNDAQPTYMQLNDTQSTTYIQPNDTLPYMHTILNDTQTLLDTLDTHPKLVFGHHNPSHTMQTNIHIPLDISPISKNEKKPNP